MLLGRMLDLIKAGATPASAAATAGGAALSPGDRSALLSVAFALETRSVIALLTAHIRSYGDAGAMVFVGGPGWDNLILPALATRVGTLDEAIAHLS